MLRRFDALFAADVVITVAVVDFGRVVVFVLLLKALAGLLNSEKEDGDLPFFKNVAGTDFCC
jgi:hypothetical protein